MAKRPFLRFWKFIATVTACSAVSWSIAVASTRATVSAEVKCQGCAAYHSEPAASQSGNTSAWDGVFTEEQAERGQESYQRDCIACHLDDLLGDGMAPALIGLPFSFRWSDLSVGDMYSAIRATMPQGAPASLSPQAYVDIIAYLLHMNGYPSGQSELRTEAATLEQIIIQDKPPQ